MIICGDCLSVMAAMPPNSVDAIVTDPPYALTANKKGGTGPASLNLASPAGRSRVTTGGGFMGKEWDSALPPVEVWTEALRVAKPGCHLLAFGGTRTFHRLACAIEDAGWEIRDTLGWMYGSGFPKSHNLKGDWDGWGTALKPAWEPIILARKPLVGTVAANVQKWGTGAINVDGCRVGTEIAGARSSNADGITRRNMAFGMREFEGNPTKGRWPANLIHDGSEEALELFPESVHGAWPARRSGIGFHKRGSGTTSDVRSESGPGSAARFFYCAKASRAERGDGSGHPTVKPLALMRYLCRLVTPPGGVVLDPFMGSGTTGMAAKAEGFEFIGIEKEAEYVEIAERRMGSSNEKP